jgi:peptide/nickel transport system substrate-binding protein
LIYIDVATSEVVGELATSWDDVNGDGTVWDLHLVQGATFHDGSPFTADDVVFTWNYVTNPENVVCALSGSYVTNCQSVEVVDDYTVRFTLAQGMPDFVSYLEMKIYCEEAFETMDAVDAAVIGTGPYYYNQDMTESGVQFVATRYDAYWGGIDSHPTKNIVFVWMPSTDTAVAALQAGEVDVLFALGASQAGIIEDDPDCKLLITEGTGSWYIGFNYNYSDLFDDLAMRQAVLESIEKESIVDVAFEGYATVSNSFVSPVGIGYSADYTYYEYDPDAAEALLADTTYNGETLIIAYPTATAGLVAQVVQASLARSVSRANWSPLIPTN